MTEEIDKGDASAGMAAAMKGDETFFAAIDAADPDTFGTCCSHCGTYHVARISLGTDNARCPNCGSKRGWCESPALGTGPASVQSSTEETDK